MKNVIKLFVVIALTAAIAFAMTACSKKASFGDELKFSNEQVYTIEQVENGNNLTVNYKPYTGDVTFNNTYGTRPTVTGGKFSFSRGAPSILDLAGVYQTLEYLNIYSSFTNVVVSDSSVSVAVVPGFGTQRGNKYLDLSMENIVLKIIITGTGENASYSGTQTNESVMFVYVDKDVKITGNGNTNTGTNTRGVPYVEKYNNLNLSLVKGWNAICTKWEQSVSATSYSSTYTYSVSIPSSLKWILREYD